MKINHTLLLALICIAVGCTKTSDTLEGLGEITSPSRTWKIELTDENPGLKIHHKIKSKSAKGNISTYPSAWENHTGAFAYVDHEDRVWAFNGNDKVFILEMLEDGATRSWDLKTWKKAVPQSVINKLPEQMIKAEPVNGAYGNPSVD